ncbi:MAG: hypothetical protein JO047_10650 [Alphaproteobacteria bacterium]|nr:hypothetical protein [Alphaproteobacteria bacterium]
MVAIATVGAGLQAAMLLAQGRPEGLRYVEPGLDGARRSFWAALICLPIFAALRMADWTAAPTPAPLAAVDVLGYIIGWAGYALLTRPVVAWLGRAQHWPRFVTAWNWCNVVQYALLLAASVPGWLGAPDWARQTAALVAIGWAIWLQWYATRLTLELGPLAAAALTGLDLLLGLALTSVTGGLAPG